MQKYDNNRVLVPLQRVEGTLTENGAMQIFLISLNGKYLVTKWQDIGQDLTPFPAMIHFLQILRQHLVQIILTILPTSFFLKILHLFHIFHKGLVSASAMLIVDDIISGWFPATSDIKYCQRLPSSAKKDYIRFTKGRRLSLGIIEMGWKCQHWFHVHECKGKWTHEGQQNIYPQCYFQYMSFAADPTLQPFKYYLSGSLLQLLLEGGSLGSWLIWRFQGIHVTWSPVAICYYSYLQQKTIYFGREIFFSPFLFKMRAWWTTSWMMFTARLGLQQKWFQSMFWNESPLIWKYSCILYPCKQH